MKYVNMMIQDKDMKILKPLLDRLDIDYSQSTIKEDDDPVLMVEAERVKNDKPLGKKESEAITRKIRERIRSGK